MIVTLPAIPVAVGALAVAAFVIGFLAYQMVADLLRYDGNPFNADLPTLSTRHLCTLVATALALLAIGYAALP